MKIIGLTGSIGMGKSATAALFRAQGVPVHDSDAEVHRLYAPGGAAVAPVEAAFPGVTGPDGGVDRTVLGARVTHDPAAMRRLEAIVHPLVAAGRDAFLRQAQQDGADIVVFDVPLLFETGGDRQADSVVVVTTDPEIQRARVLARPGMTPQKFDAILAKQMPDAEKRARADHLIDTGHGLDHAAAQVAALLAKLRGQPSADA